MSILLSGFHSWAVIVCLLTYTLRAIFALVAIHSLNCPNLYRWLWAMPLRDLMSFFIWVAGAFGQSIYWRGRWLQVEAGGILKEVNG